MHEQHLAGFTVLAAVVMASLPSGCGCGGRTTLSSIRDAGADAYDGSLAGSGGGSGDAGVATTGGADGGAKDGKGGAGGLSGNGGAAGGPAGGGGAGVGGSGRGGAGVGGMAGAGGAGAGGSGKGGAGAGGAATGGAAIGDAATGGTGGAGGLDAGVGEAGAPLWRNSHQPFCQAKGGTFPLVMGVWSEPRAVSLLVYDALNAPALWTNPGTGWQTAYTWPQGTVASSGPGKVGLRGVAQGPRFVFGVQPCWIQLVEGTTVTCSGAARDIADVAPVSASLAYAAYANRLLRFDGSFWTQLGDPLPLGTMPGALWANSSTLVLVADAANVYVSQSEGKPELQAGLPAVGYTAAWGTGDKDVWIGSRDGRLFHYDGAAWTEVGSLPSDGLGIIKLWGADGQVFAITAQVFARWDGARLDTLETLGEGKLYRDLWGNSAKEVFVTRYDWLDDACAFQASWFDGAVMVRF